MTAPIKVVVEGAPAAVKAFLNGADDAAKAATKVTKSADDVAEAVADKTSKVKDAASKSKDAAKTTAGKSKESAKKAGTAAKDAAKKSKSGLLNTIKKHPKTSIAAGLLGAGALTLGGSDDARDTAGDLVDAAKDKISAADKWLFGGDGDSDNPFSTTASGEDIIEVDPTVMYAFIADLRSHAEDLTAALTAAPKAFASLRERLSKDGLGTSTRSGKPSPIFEDLDTALEAAEGRYVSVTKALIAQFSGDAARLEKIVKAHMENESTSAAKMTEVAV